MRSPPPTHPSLPQHDPKRSGQSAALAGGTTMHIDFALPVDGSLEAGLAAWHAKAAGSVADYGFHMAVTGWDEGTTPAEMAAVAAAGVNSFKFFMAYKGSLMVDDGALLRGMAEAKALGALAQVHAENGEAVAWGQERVAGQGVTAPHGHALSRPAELEAEATGRAARLAGLVNAPLYVVHVMSGGAADEVAAARCATGRGWAWPAGWPACSWAGRAKRRRVGGGDFRVRAQISSGSGPEERLGFTNSPVPPRLPPTHTPKKGVVASTSWERPWPQPSR